MLRQFLVFVLVVSLPLSGGCKKDPAISFPSSYKTRKVVLVSIDGARWTETWGADGRQFIPYRSGELLQQGVLVTSFRNSGYTYTSPSHAAMLSGFYQPLDNGGNERPQPPNIFQYWRKAKVAPAEQAWLISSKDKIEALADCRDPHWKGSYLPRTDCGVNGLGSGYRNDSVTLKRALEVLQQYRPELMMVHFREPDYSGHAGDWTAYIEGIRNTDRYVRQLWNRLQADPVYAGVTTMIVTNDHGRHTGQGFAGHGDDCEGCRHIELLVLGPDVEKGKEVARTYELRDIAPTVAALLGFQMGPQEGQVMCGILNGNE